MRSVCFVGGRFVLQSKHEETGAEECIGAVHSNLRRRAEICCSLQSERSGTCMQKGASICLCAFGVSIKFHLHGCMHIVPGFFLWCQHNAKLLSTRRDTFDLRQQDCKGTYFI